MRRRTLVAAVVVAATLFTTTACDVVGQPDWAVRVDGTDIPMADVEALMKVFDDSAAAQGAPAPPEILGGLDGTTARQAASLLLQWELSARALGDLGVEVTDQDRQSAEQQVQGIDVAEGLRERIVEGIASSIALSGAVAGSLDDPALEPLLDEFYAVTEADTGWSDWVCLEGLAVREADLSEVEGQLAGGASFEDVLNSDPEQLQPLFQTGVSDCLPAGQVPEDTAGVLDATDDGDLARQTVQDPNVGTVVLLMRELGTRDIARDDPLVAQLLSSALAGRDAQRWITRYVGTVAADVDIEVLPSVGRGVDLESLTVLAPVSPITPTTAAPLTP